MLRDMLPEDEEKMSPAHFNIEFDERDHSYVVDGDSGYGSVTQILQAEGLSGSTFWKDEHRHRGTAVHKIALLIGKRPIVGKTVDEVIENSLWDPSTTAPGLVGYGRSVAKFYLESGFQPELVEQPVASKRFRVVGTLDAWGRLPDGETFMPDFKSGEPQDAAWVQTAIYVMCLEETFGLKTDKRAPVWIMPDENYKIKPPRPAGGEDLIIGQCAINLYNWRVRHKMVA